MLGRRKKSALLIDFDNVISMTGGEFATTIPKWLAWLEDGGFDPSKKRRSFEVKRVYWNGQNERYRKAFEDAGFEAFACRAIAKDKKSSADIVLTLDAMEIAGTIRGLREVLLLSSDTDFVPVVGRLQDKGLDVVAMGNEENATAAVYREYADDVVLRRDFTEAFGYQAPSRDWLGRANAGLTSRKAAESESPQPEPASPTKPLVKKTPAPQPKTTMNSLDEGAKLLVRAAEGALGAPLSREKVRRALQAVRGFSTTGAQPWLNCGSYDKLVRTMVQKRPNDLRLHKHANGGISLAYRVQE
jgi:uncharacterized LabA/DUF88 family protein